MLRAGCRDPITLRESGQSYAYGASCSFGLGAQRATLWCERAKQLFSTQFLYMGSLPSLSPRDVQTGASVDNRHMLSDGTNHHRILKETEKQSGRVAIVATIVWVGIAWKAAALSPRKLESVLWTPSPNERLPPYPGLLIPPLPAPERYDLSHHPIVRPRSAHAARC